MKWLRLKLRKEITVASTMPLMCSWDYSKLTVEVKLEPGAAEPPTVKVKRVVHTKEVIAEELKREMGLHDSRGKRSRSRFFYMQNGLPSVIS